MPKAKVQDVLRHAMENRYGVAAINTFNVETGKYAIQAAQREKMPIIIQFYPGYDYYIQPEFVAHAFCRMAQEATVPVAVHLDHSKSFEIAVAGIRDGFPSVMVDGSSLPLEENIALTAAVVRTAKVFGVDVEAELGHVGDGSSEDDIVNSDHYTKVEQAVEFVERTGCGSLALAVGNAHGPYVKTPNLDFERIQAIRRKVDIPLVLHGCSDIPSDQIQQAVNLGMSKFNIATEYFRAMYRAMEAEMVDDRHRQDAFAMMTCLPEAMIQFVVSKIRLLNPNHFSL